MVDPLAGANPLRPNPLLQAGGAGPTAEVANTFGDILTSYMEGLQQDRATSMGLTQEFLMGGAVDVSQVAIAMNQVSLSMQLLVEVRNKILDAYETLLRMPV